MRIEVNFLRKGEKDPLLDEIKGRKIEHHDKSTLYLLEKEEKAAAEMSSSEGFYRSGSDDYQVGTCLRASSEYVFTNKRSHS